MNNWEMELTAGRKTLAEVKIQGGIFLENALSSFLLVITIILLNHILRKHTSGFKFTKLQEKIYPLMYMVDIELFKKYEWSKTLFRQ